MSERAITVQHMIEAWNKAASDGGVTEDMMGAALDVARANSSDVSVPVDMLLFCPDCGKQHVDEPDHRTPDWKNPPHKSHLCHFCKAIWRQADVPTNGVAEIKTRGTADTWQRPYTERVQPASPHAKGDGDG